MMNLTITDKDLKATDAIKDYVEKKMPRIEKYFGEEDFDVNVKIKAEKNIQIAEIFITAKGVNYKAVTEGSDLYASIDKDIDIIESQIRKEKTKKERAQKDGSIKQFAAEGSTVPTIENEILKVTHYDIKPIDVEDAKLKLSEKTTNSFLTFINVETGKVNVIYKLKDGLNYGIVEPE
ncbi:MAG: ribosome-associated translation inhibitor RaiA [Clostridia bacterium]|nr:ribosome-associated translation inhibitor RaiA [Clostridia bacterium]